MKKYLLLLAALVTASMSLSAQQLKEGYIKWPESAKLHVYIPAWKNAGYKLTALEGTAWEDEEFFISRVKPRVRFRDAVTQVYDKFTETNDKRICWWVPVGDISLNSVHVNGFPNGRFDSEAFTLWSYIDHWGDWTCPHGWVPGAVSDAAHKNGVAVSGVASIPYGSISTTWSTCLNGMNSVNNNNNTVIGEFLYYHGVDGLGYNSEFTGSSSTVSGTMNLHNNLATFMTGKNPIFENIWYAGTTDSGGISFDNGIGSFTGLFKSASMFLNYNYSGTLGGCVTTAANVRDVNGNARNALYVYAGNNMQGGEPRSGNNWVPLSQSNVSIGLWGAHQTNMFWSRRNSNGSTPDAMQRTYMNTCEQWFTNGRRNPARRIAVKNQTQHHPNDNFCGMSSMMTARSVLNWKIADEPFITYFNTGNGKYFNWMGERISDKEWYSFAIQDYMPTWRFWFSDTFMNGNVAEGSTHMDAEITWDDAWFGGASLRVKGTSTKEYLQLFKTHFTIANGQTLRVRYKLLGGSAKVTLVMKEANSTAEWAPLQILDPADAEELVAQSFDDGAAGWVTKELKINAVTVRGKGAVQMIGLKFENAENLNMLIGELSITKNANLTTPAAPTLKSSRVLANNKDGVDGKLFWEMPGKNAAPAPTYNQDLNVSMFRMWAQEEGGEQQFVGATTTWAGIAFQCPNQIEGSRIRFGVSALSLDHRTESDISWGSYLDKGAYEISSDINVDKKVIKPREDFTMGYVDPQHAAGTWVITDQAGNTHFTGTGHTVHVTSGLPTTGSYNIRLSSGGVTTDYASYIGVSGTEVGALPHIGKLTIDGREVSQSSSDVEIIEGSKLTFGYEGRQADGVASRGIDLNENWFGVQVSELGLASYQSFSVAAWVKYNQLPEGRSNFITIENRAGSWPYNNWGYFWSRITDAGTFVYDNIDTSWGMRTHTDGTEGTRLFYQYPEAKLTPGAWAHVVIVFEYSGTNLRQHFYINGKKQLVGAYMSINKGTFENNCGGNWANFEPLMRYATVKGTNTYEPEYAPTNKPLASSDWIAFGGSAHEITAVQGCVDDFQIWDKAMTDDDVRTSMNGLDGNNLPSGVLAYWDFETPANAQHAFIAKGKKQAKAYWYSMVAGSSEGQSIQTPAEAFFLGGCPYISGTAYPIVTTPTWTSKRATINGSGTDLAGNADITFSGTGDRIVTLKLENGHGVANAQYPVIRLAAGVEGVSADGAEVNAYTIDDALFVEFDEDGNYGVDVYNTAGLLVASKQQNMTAGQNFCVRLNTPGVYVVRVVRDGAVARTVKVIRK